MKPIQVKLMITAKYDFEGFGIIEHIATERIHNPKLEAEQNHDRGEDSGKAQNNAKNIPPINCKVANGDTKREQKDVAATGS